MNFLEQSKWRYATKQFDANKTVIDSEIDYIKEAVQLSASSFGLQPYTILDIRTAEIREGLKPISNNQTPVTDASHLFVFCNHLSVTDEEIENLVQEKAKAFGVPFEQLSNYVTHIKSKLNKKSELEIKNWTANQTYIALANAMAAAAELQLDTLPMEGFDKQAVNQYLKLKETNLNASVMLAIGYRHKDDRAQHNQKVRKPIESLFSKR